MATRETCRPSGGSERATASRPRHRTGADTVLGRSRDTQSCTLKWQVNNYDIFLKEYTDKSNSSISNQIAFVVTFG